MKTRPTPWLTRILPLTGALLVSGCANYAGIAPETPAFDSRQIERQATQFADWPQENWWQQLNDPVLSGLIEQALRDSPNLQAAAARLRRAEAAAGTAESALWPQIGLGTTNTREHFSQRGTTPPPYAGTTQSINEVQFSGLWEIDFFGKNRNALRAALGEVQARAAEQQATRQLLAANVARNYYNLARLIAQRELAEDRQKQRVELAALVKRRVDAGIDTKVELEQASGVIPENSRDIAAYDEQIGIARHALSAVLGQLPDATAKLAPKLPETTLLSLPEALPAELLGHRADVVAARWRVEAATRTLDSTRALFYPNVNLRGFTGLTAIGVDQWFDSGSRQSGIGAAINLPIFDAGRLRSQYRSSAAQVDESVAAYNGALLEAVREVADQLSTLQAVERQIEHQQATLKSAERSYQLASQRYRADISDRLSVLNAETGLLNQRRASLDLQARRIDSQIRLTHALGGGFVASTPTGMASIFPVNR